MIITKYKTFLNEEVDAPTTGTKIKQEDIVKDVKSLVQLMKDLQNKRRQEKSDSTPELVVGQKYTYTRTEGGENIQIVLSAITDKYLCTPVDGGKNIPVSKDRKSFFKKIEEEPKKEEIELGYVYKYKNSNQVEMKVFTFAFNTGGTDGSNQTIIGYEWADNRYLSALTIGKLYGKGENNFTAISNIMTTLSDLPNIDTVKKLNRLFNLYEKFQKNYSVIFNKYIDTFNKLKEKLKGWRFEHGIYNTTEEKEEAKKEKQGKDNNQQPNNQKKQGNVDSNKQMNNQNK